MQAGQLLSGHFRSSQPQICCLALQHPSHARWQSVVARRHRSNLIQSRCVRMWATLVGWSRAVQARFSVFGANERLCFDSLGSLDSLKVAERERERVKGRPRCPSSIGGDNIYIAPNAQRTMNADTSRLSIRPTDSAHNKASSPAPVHSPTKFGADSLHAAGRSLSACSRASPPPTTVVSTLLALNEMNST